MKTKNKILHSLFLLFIFTTWLHAKEKPVKSNVQKAPRNIVFLFADDLGWVDVSTGQTNEGRGSKVYNTPNIDKLAEGGLSFTHAYTQPNCSPTRASLISGMYATGKDNGVYNVSSLARQSKLTEGFPDLPIVPFVQKKALTGKCISIFEMAKMSALKYQTAFVGKEHGTTNIQRGFGVDSPAGFLHEVKGTVKGKKVKVFYHAVNDDKKGWTFGSKAMQKYAAPYDKKYIKNILKPFSKQSDTSLLLGTAKHVTDGIGDFAVNFIRENAAKKKPFFLYVPFHAVHSKVFGRLDLTKKYEAKGLNKKEAEYAALIELLDQNIGKVVNALKDPNGDGNTSDDITNDTLFIVYSDNGGTQGNAPLTGGKGTFTEGGIRVPLICSWPGVIEAKTITNQSVHCIDFYPTLAELMAVDISDLGKKFDGVSFAKILTGEKKRLERNNLFWHFPGYMGSRLRPTTMTHTRVGDVYYKLFYFYEKEEFKMFNINEDISEKNNLLEKPTAETMKLALEMNKDMTQWLKDNKAPTGTWKEDGKKVPYPSPSAVKKYK